MIELPVDFTTDLIANANEQIANFSPVLLVILGISLSLLAIGAIIRFLK
jgi:hypothetical protein